MLNQTLAERRADAVRDTLAKDGVSAGRLSARGAGESRPIATNETAEGRARNRRVEIVSRPDESLAAEGSGERGAPPPAPQDEPR